MKRYLMYKSIMKYLTDKDLSLNAKGFLSMVLFNDEINALELSKYCSDDIETIKDTMLELRIMKYVKYDPETNMLLAGPKPYDEWDEEIIEDLHRKANNKKDKEDIYVEVVDDMYNNQIISEKTYDEVLGYDEQKTKDNDSFEL